MHRMTRGIGAALVVTALLGAGDGLAYSEAEHLETRPSGGAMVVDALFARPLLAAATVGGAAVFLVSLPFSALGGNVDAAAEALVKTPAEATFRRCLGCTISRRADEL